MAGAGAGAGGCSGAVVSAGLGSVVSAALGSVVSVGALADALTFRFFPPLRRRASLAQTSHCDGSVMDAS